ncbi:hypothetical protein LTR66_006862 [Elasticomyces elasticus]|nr:hypothetical protein LTR66_006862 [Elasticomyces elasticus]
MRLQHIHLPSLSPYTRASALQDRLVHACLAYKASPSLHPVLKPSIITAQFHPVYTCGRREQGTVSAEQQAYLCADGRADFHYTLRGGQTTFHGPGQLVAYPILDLKRHGLTPRTYVSLLERTLIKTCAQYGISTMTTEHPGVWVTPDSKIAALGVHLRRNITSHGIGLNINTDLWWFSRIVACGLEGKSTTSFQDQGVVDKSVEEVGQAFVQNMATALEGVESIDEVAEDAIPP